VPVITVDVISAGVKVAVAGSVTVEVDAGKVLLALRKS
jgi:hypothetical protein